ncbi:MAG TPA: hypothetical protein VKB35_01690 [Ktedonobacteraceae bacterium]|nr:hypothetical protein [Ktedonobacteraceae bacterium]
MVWRRARHTNVTALANGSAMETRQRHDLNGGTARVSLDTVSASIERQGKI